jgi:predicted SnoaL-like aldol condensation-catalyzing enzyme
MAGPQENKRTVLAYYNMAFNDRRPAEAAQKYGGPHYIQHNPQAADGFEAFVEFVEGFAEQFPQMSFDIKRAVAEGDLVVTHSLPKTSHEDRGTTAADIFRLEDGKVVEHWDVLQPVPESAANDHPMFLASPGRRRSALCLASFYPLFTGVRGRAFCELRLDGVLERSS